MLIFAGPVPVRIKRTAGHVAHNTALGVTIGTGTPDFAAVLAQEVQQARWNMALTWLPLPVLVALAGLLSSWHPVAMAAAGLGWILLANQRWLLRKRRARNEVFGHAVEVAAWELLNHGANPARKAWTEARTLAKPWASYTADGYVAALGFDKLPWDDLPFPEASPRQAAFARLMQDDQARAFRWCRNHVVDKLERWAGIP